MRLLLAGPCSTAYFRSALGVALEGAPEGLAQTPVGPLAVELARRGLAVHVVTLDPSICAPVRLSAGGISLHYLPLRPRARNRSLDLFEKEIRLIRREIEAVAPDVIHAHWTYEYAEAARRVDPDCLVTAHDSPLDVFLIFRDAYRFLRLVRALATVPRLRRLTCVSPWIVPRLRLLGFRGELAVVPNGIDMPCGARRPTTEMLLQHPVIVSAGNASRLKNIAAIARAFPKIRQSFPQAELHLFGNGLTSDTWGGAGIIAHGAVPHSELMQFLEENATILVHPSLSETLPVTPLEAMARGIPVIARRGTHGVEAIFRSRFADCLIDVNCPERMCEAVKNILESKQKYSRLATRCVQYVSKHYTIRAVADKYISLYRI